ncbi:DUF2971 domain-containing protein [Celeribacter baekdonensis]|uniref:DUF2971 domain-containing protein n=1 Tax=Celeribacter baekdonensis TaxID=875171 RepID=UPI003A90A825
MSNYTKFNFPLFRYRRNDTAYVFEEIERALTNREIFLSSAAIQNDPFENMPVYEPSSLRKIKQAFEDYGSSSKILSKDYWERHLGAQMTSSQFKFVSKDLRKPTVREKMELKLAKRVLSDVPSKTVLACLSADGHNLPMWAHYANNHMGYAIEYEVDIAETLTHENRGVHEVIYSEERPVVSTIDVMEFTARTELRMYSDIDSASLLSAIFLTKSDHWSYEKEFRVFDSFIEPSYVRISCLVPKRIVFGLNAQKAFREEMIAAVDGRVGCFQAHLSSSHFKLDCAPVS